MEVKTRLELLTGLILHQDIFINVQKGVKERYGVNLFIENKDYFVDSELEYYLKIELEGYILGSIQGTVLAIEVKHKFISEEYEDYLQSLKEKVKNIMNQFVMEGVN